MHRSLPWQPGRSIELEIAPEALVCQFTGPGCESLADLKEAAGEAFDHPLDFPPLAQAVVPGDRVVLALEAHVPGDAAVVAAAVERLMAAGVEPWDICVLQESATLNADRLSQYLPSSAALAIHFEVHDPENVDQMAFLTSTQDQMPIMLNRQLVDADLVVPIGCHRPEQSAGHDGAAGTVCPTFSDKQTKEHFRAFHTSAVATRHKGKAQAKATEISWLLGVQLVVRVVPWDAAGVARIVAGCEAAANAAANEATREVWHAKAPRRASLVVAAVTGGPAEQSWENLGRAVALAAEVVDDDGTIVVCCDLRDPPGPCMQQLGGAEDHVAALSQIRQLREYDAVAAAQVARAMEHAQICLMSSLSGDVVENLGLVHVNDTAEIARLVKAHSSCILISSAQYASIEIAEPLTA